MISSGVSSRRRIGSQTNVPITVKTAASANTKIVEVQTAVFSRPNSFSPNSCETMTLMPMPQPKANAINSMVTAYEAPTAASAFLPQNCPATTLSTML